jgi:DNA-binding CsgD family transcriptional regulator
LLTVAEAGATDDGQSAQQMLLRARIAFASRRGGDAPLLFLAVAERLTPLDEPLARERYLEALMASIFAGRLSGQAGADPNSVAQAAKAAPPPPRPARAVDLLLATGEEADALYRTAIRHLERTGITMLVTRAHLIYGEWLRRENRRTDAREQLRRAHGLFVKAGADAFADRACRQPVATGESVAMQDAEPEDLLTGQESAVARLARDGYTNQEIAAQLFISPGTVEWHLSKVFNKLQIRSRRGLRMALAGTRWS